MNKLFLYLKSWLTIKLLKIRNRPMDFVTYPDKRLRTPCEPIDFETSTYEERSEIVRKMGNALSSASYGGKLGLAANQIGITKCVAIVQGAVMFNPTWQPAKQQFDYIVEGCYSVPNRQFKVKRDKYGWGTWYDIDGNKKSYKMKGLSAIVFQHEVDHLNGICCCEKGEEVHG